MRLLTKGLLIVAIPSVFEVVLLGALFNSQSDAEDAERWAAHSALVMNKAAEVREPMLLESARIRNAVIIDDFTPEPVGEQHELLMANMFAQAEALAFGKTAAQVREEGTAEELVAHRVFEGSRPSNSMLVEKLTPYSLGTLVALYEHSVFTQGVIWNVDSFDQWGVELGKALAKRTARQLIDPAQPLHHDSSTNALIRRFRDCNGSTPLQARAA